MSERKVSDYVHLAIIIIRYARVKPQGIIHGIHCCGTQREIVVGRSREHLAGACQQADNGQKHQFSHFHKKLIVNKKDCLFCSKFKTLKPWIGTSAAAIRYNRRPSRYFLLKKADFIGKFPYFWRFSFDFEEAFEGVPCRAVNRDAIHAIGQRRHVDGVVVAVDLCRNRYNPSRNWSDFHVIIIHIPVPVNDNGLGVSVVERIWFIGGSRQIVVGAMMALVEKINTLFITILCCANSRQHSNK